MGLIDEIATFVKAFTDAILEFQSLLTQIAPHLASRVEMFVQAHDSLKDVVEERSKTANTLTIHELQLQVPDDVTVYNRASLLVHLDSLVSRPFAQTELSLTASQFFACPKIDQNTLIAYLQARYKVSHRDICTPSRIY